MTNDFNTITVEGKPFAYSIYTKCTFPHVPEHILNRWPLLKISDEQGNEQEFLYDSKRHTIESIIRYHYGWLGWGTERF